MKIYIIRHGETDGNKKGIFQGSTDIPLNDNGISLAKITGRALKSVHFDMCFSSSLKRAAKTAELVLQESGNTKCPIYYDERLKEINMGEWEGKKMRPGECEVPYDHVKAFFIDPFEMPFVPQGESPRDVCRRTQEFLKELAQRNDEKTYLVSTHGFALRAMLNFLYDVQDDFWQGHVPYNCSISVVDVKDGIMLLERSDMVLYDNGKIDDRYSGLTE